MPASLALFLQLAGVAAPSSELVVAAASSPRPAECAPAARRASELRSHFWERATSPQVRKYCDALARGWARLARAPAEALALAAQAEEALPGKPGSVLLGARALLALGRPQDAHERFQALRGTWPAALEAPAALHDAARAALVTGHAAEAVAAYRALVPRAGLLEGARRRQTAYLEAALAVLADGPAALDEAIGYLGEARRRGGAPGIGPWVAGALALALDRQDRREQAAGVAAEAGGPWVLERARGAAGTRAAPSLPAGELDAVIAVLAERDDRELALRRWQSFLEGPGAQGPFADHARRRLAALGARRPRR